MRKSVFGLCVLLMLPVAAQSDDGALKAELEALKKRVEVLEKRLNIVEEKPAQVVVEKTPIVMEDKGPQNPGDANDLDNWNRLQVGHDYKDVRELLGAPVSVRKGGMEFWYYSDKGADGPMVKFLFRKVNAWKAPAP